MSPFLLTAWAIQSSAGFCSFTDYATGLYHLLRVFIDFINSIIFMGEMIMGESRSTCITSQNGTFLSEKYH